MARVLYGNTPADFTLSRSGKIVPDAPLTVWTDVSAGTQVTDLLDYANQPVATITSDDSGLVRFYGPDGTDSTLWIQSGSSTRLAVRPVNLPRPDLEIGTVTTGTADVTLTPNGLEGYTMDLVLPTAGANGVNTAAIQDGAVTADKIAANAVGASELADNAVDAAAIAADDLGNGLVLTADSGEPSGMKWSAYGIADLDIGTVDTGTPAAASMTGNPQDGYALNLTLPPVGNGSISDVAVAADADIDRSKIAGTALTADSMGVFNVKDYGATGDGATDDTAAIEAAITAAGPGGVVLFPPGNYGVASPLTPLAGQRWEGSHSPTWDAADDLGAGCSIDALPGFSGASLIAWADTSPGVIFTYLCFNGLGDEHGTTLHGFHLGGDTGGERGWTIRDCTIHGFSGYGLTGRLHVIDLRDSHISRCGWGLRVVGNQALRDARIIGCQIYMNRYGGIGLDGDYRSGAVSIIGTRVERSGGTPYDPDNPRVAYAPGIRLTNATNINVLAVNTDANTGPGFEVAADPDNDLLVHAIQVTGCGFARDGGGDQVAPQIPGIKLVNARFVNIVATAVTWGKANDSGGSGPFTPYHALWVEDSWFCHVANCWLEAETSANSLHLVGDNYRSSVSGSIEAEIDATAFISDTAAPTNPMPGQWYWSTSTNEAKFYDGTEWVRADGTTGGDNSRLALWDDGSGDKRIVFQSDDLDLWTIAVQSDANGQGLTVQRMDALGDYLDTPVYIDHDSGMLFVDPVWIANGTASQVPLTVRHGSTSPTVSYVDVTDSDGNGKFQVLWNGTLRSNWGDSRYAMTQIGSTQVVREGATGSQTLIGAYTSVADADGDSPVFEVQADGSVWSDYVLGSGDEGKYLTPKAYVDGIKTSLKAEVAASTDFADFQSRIASW